MKSITIILMFALLAVSGLATTFNEQINISRQGDYFNLTTESTTYLLFVNSTNAQTFTSSLNRDTNGTSCNNDILNNLTTTCNGVISSMIPLSKALSDQHSYYEAYTDCNANRSVTQSALEAQMQKQDLKPQLDASNAQVVQLQAQLTSLGQQTQNLQNQNTVLTAENKSLNFMQTLAYIFGALLAIAGIYWKMNLQKKAADPRAENAGFTTRQR